MSRYLGSYINFRIENIGGGAARNILLRLSREFDLGNDRLLNDVGLLKCGIPLLGPGRNVETFLANALDNNLLEQEPLEVTSEYEDASGGKFEEIFLVDFAAFENLCRVGEAPLYTIAKSIKDLQLNISNLSSGMKKLSVLVYSRDDQDAEISSWNIQRKLRQLSPNQRKDFEDILDKKISLCGDKTAAHSEAR